MKPLSRGRTRVWSQYTGHSCCEEDMDHWLMVFSLWLQLSVWCDATVVQWRHLCCQREAFFWRPMSAVFILSPRPDCWRSVSLKLQPCVRSDSSSLSSHAPPSFRSLMLIWSLILTGCLGNGRAALLPVETVGRGRDAQRKGQCYPPPCFVCSFRVFSSLTNLLKLFIRRSFGRN